MHDNIDFLGAGIAFPFAPARGRLFHLVGGEQKLEQSIRVILGTPIGERPMRPEFGCKIWEFMFAPIDETTLSLMEDGVREALGRWEPRITVDSVVAERNSEAAGRVDLTITFRIRASNDERNLVAPFYTIPGEAELDRGPSDQPGSRETR